jgi:hypothetical protein
MSAPASQTQWYLARDGQQFGPLSDAELARFIELGHLQPTDLLWRDGFPDWRPAMVVFPPARRPAAPRPAPSMRPAPAPVQPAASPRAGREQVPKYQGNPRAAHAGKQASRAERARYAEPEEPQGRGGGLKKVLLAVVCLALLGAAGWYAFPHRATLMASAKALPSRLIAVVSAMKGQDASPLRGLSGPPETIDARLQATRWVRRQAGASRLGRRVLGGVEVAAQNRSS